MDAVSCNYLILYTVDDSVDTDVGSGQSWSSKILLRFILVAVLLLWMGIIKIEHGSRY